MKTPEEHHVNCPMTRTVWNSKEGLHWIAEIQHDAREGMVPVEDVRPLIGHVTQTLNLWPGAKQDVVSSLEFLRAKHPDLFTL